MRTGRSQAGRTAATLLLLVVACATVTIPATAADLDTLRERAQVLGDEVTALETELSGLQRKRTRLSSEIEEASSRLGELELDKHNVEQAYTRAYRAYVQRAVEAYKDGGSATELALVLSADTLSEMFARVEAAVSSANVDSSRLKALLAAKREATRAQTSIDRRKQMLLVKEERVAALTGEIDSRLELRSATLARLTAEIHELERQAREAARLAAEPEEAFVKLLGGSGPALDIPKGFVGTGVTFEGIASWYGPGFEGNPTASGDIFDPSLFTAASKELPLGTWLFVQYKGKGVVVLVNDRGPYVHGRILDLSQAAAEALGIGGLGWIKAEIILKA